MLTGVFNFVNTVLSPNMGILLNKLFVGVTSAHLDNYYQLAVIGMFCSLIPWAFIRLIPTKAEVDASTVNNLSTSKQQLVETPSSSIDTPDEIEEDIITMKQSPTSVGKR